MLWKNIKSQCFPGGYIEQKFTNTLSNNISFCYYLSKPLNNQPLEINLISFSKQIFLQKSLSNSQEGLLEMYIFLPFCVFNGF